MEKDFKQYCVDYNERKDQKINQTLAQQNEMIGVLRAHMGDLDAKYKTFSDKINASMNNSINSILSIHTEEQQSIDKLKLANKQIRNEISYCTSQMRAL